MAFGLSFSSGSSAAGDRLSDKHTRTLEELCAKIRDVAIVGVGVATVEEIDTLNIFWATMLAMTRAVDALGLVPAMVLVDGNRCPNWNHTSTAIVGGDALCLSIAAASIVAKVTRDRMMVRADSVFPAYGFASHVGYATAVHRAGIDRHGPCSLHRMSFRPLRKDEEADTEIQFDAGILD